MSSEKLTPVLQELFSGLVALSAVVGTFIIYLKTSSVPVPIGTLDGMVAAFYFTRAATTTGFNNGVQLKVRDVISSLPPEALRSVRENPPTMRDVDGKP